MLKMASIGVLTIDGINASVPCVMKKCLSYLLIYLYLFELKAKAWTTPLIYKYDVIFFQLHPATCPLKVDEDGLYPEWVLYHELVATPRPYLRHICAVENSWVVPSLEKLQNVDIRSLR